MDELSDLPVLGPDGRPLEETFDREALARAAGLSAAAVARFVAFGLIDPLSLPGAAGGEIFAAATLARIARIQRLRSELRVNLAGAGLVLELLERVETLERELARRRR